MLIVLAAIGYYGSYINYWFNPHDEGGTAAFIAMRLLAGEVPLRDVELGYNVLWFWPIVALFKVGGVNFLAMRAYFFLLSTITALCGWALVRRVTRNEWAALAIGLALVVFPGSQFKNYIPLLCVANTLCLVEAALVSGGIPARFWRRVAIGGLVLGLSLLIRIEIGLLFFVIWAGLFFLRLFQSGLRATARWIDTITAAAILSAAVILVHAPAFALAQAQGFHRPFLRQYPGWVNYLTLQTNAAPAQSAAGERRPRTAPRRKLRPKNAPPISRATLPRMDWRTFISFSEPDKSVLFVLTYLPLAAYFALIGWAAFSVLRALFQRAFALENPSTIALLLLGGSLTTFPQFFFFRPDRPHLSEFMPGYIVATVCVALLLTSRRAQIFTGLFLAVQFALYGWFALDHYSAGTIAARTKIKEGKRVFFDAANGVRVWVHKKDFVKLEGVRRAIVDHAAPGEWVVCYPYQPGYNLMTGRPTYERELYIDNATAPWNPVTMRPRNWSREALRRIEEKRPAVIVIDERAINRLEDSRFSRWAAPVYEYVQTNYHAAGKFDTIEVYARDPEPASAP